MNYERKSNEHQFPKAARGEKAVCNESQSNAVENESQPKEVAAEPGIDEVNQVSRSKKQRRKQARRETHAILGAFLDSCLGP
eukprot:1075769-Karenia_brevis.AAC.1